MPIQYRTDETGSFVRFGTSGHKYYYTNDRTLQLATNKAIKQGQAIEISKVQKPEEIIPNKVIKNVPKIDIVPKVKDTKPAKDKIKKVRTSAQIKADKERMAALRAKRKT